MDFNGQHNSDTDNLNLDRAYLEAEDLFAEADALIKEEKIRESVELLFKILQRNPNFGKAYNHLGWIYENKYKNYPRAEDYYKKAMQLTPEYAASYLNYIYFLSNLSRFDELKAHLDKTSQIPSVARETIYNEYAIMFEMTGKPEEAMDFYMKTAMATLDSEKLNRCKESINRCKTKVELKNSLGSFTPSGGNY